MKQWIVLLLSVMLIPAASAQTPSKLWGQNGEAWSPSSRLPDFSFAGYHRGEKEIPAVEATANVKDFGAVGDGDQDDTQAFKDAIAQTSQGAIMIPAGRYKITDILEIRKPNLVLRGKGPEQTTLFFPEYLNDIKPNWGSTTSGRPTSNYSWSGGFIWVKGSYNSKRLARIRQSAQRGENRDQTI